MSSVMSSVRIGCANSWFGIKKALVLPGLSIASLTVLFFSPMRHPLSPL